MSIRMRVSWRGLEEIQRRLDMMPREVAGEHLREVALAGAEVIRQQAVQNALKHKRTGNLAEHIAKEIAKETTGSRVVVHIGPTREAWYGRLVEFGHKLVRVTGRVRRGRRVYRIKQELGHVPPYPWLRPALDGKKREAQQVMAEEFQRRLGLQ